MFALKYRDKRSMMMATKKSIVVSAIEIVLWPVEPITPPITDAADSESKNFARPSFCSLLKEIFMFLRLELFLVAFAQRTQFCTTMRARVISVDDRKFVTIKALLQTAIEIVRHRCVPCCFA